MLCALVLKQSVKHFPNRVDMIYFWLRVYQDVIHRSKHLLADHVMKDIVNKLLEYSRTIAQAKWHHQVFQVTVRSDKGCLKLVPLFDAHQIVSGVQVQFGKDAGLRERYLQRWQESYGTLKSKGYQVEKQSSQLSLYLGEP